MAEHHDHANLIWQIADLLRGPYRPPQYERVMLPMTVLRRFDCVLAPTKAKVLTEFEKRKGGKLQDDALDRFLNKAAGQRFHNHSQLDFHKLKGDPDNIEKHLVSYIKGFSANVRTIFDFFEFEAEIEKMREANILYLVVAKFCDVDLHPTVVKNDEMGLIFENLIRRFNELANETAGDHFTPREVIRLMVHILFYEDDHLLATPGTVRKLLDPACGTGGMLAEAQNYLREHHCAAKLYTYRNTAVIEGEERERNPHFLGARPATAISATVERFLEGFQRLRVEENPLRLLVDKQGVTLNLSQLSDGERSFLALVSDLGRRLALANPLLENPLHGAGVILIDELELHLHPKWQLEVVEKLRSAFPNIQFIVTTHSPFILQTAREGEIMKLDGDLAVEPAGRTLEEVARLVMDVTNTDRSPRHQKMLDTARRYLALVDEAKAAQPARRDKIQHELVEMLAPFTDNPAYTALLERKGAIEPVA